MAGTAGQGPRALSLENRHLTLAPVIAASAPAGGSAGLVGSDAMTLTLTSTLNAVPSLKLPAGYVLSSPTANPLLLEPGPAALVAASPAGCTTAGLDVTLPGLLLNAAAGLNTANVGLERGALEPAGRGTSGGLLRSLTAAAELSMPGTGSITLLTLPATAATATRNKLMEPRDPASVGPHTTPRGTLHDANEQQPVGPSRGDAGGWSVVGHCAAAAVAVAHRRPPQGRKIG